MTEAKVLWLNRLAERCEQKALGSIQAALNSTACNSRKNENREVGVEWLKIAALLRALDRTGRDA